MSALLARGVPTLRWAVSAAALGLLAWWASRQHVVVPTGGHALSGLAAALAVYCAGTLLRGERWHRLLAVWGGRWKRADAYATTLVGYMGNNVLPARAGDVLKTGLAAGRARLGVADAIGATVAERVLDAAALAALFLAAGAVAVRHGPSRLELVLVVAGGAAVLAALLAIAARSQRLRGPVTRALRPARALAGPAGAALLGLSLAVWVLEAMVYLLVAHAVGLPLGVPGAAYVVGLTNLTALVPAAPGYLGTFDAAVLLGLAAVGVKAPVSYVLVLRAVLFVPITAAGAIALATRYGGLRALRPQASRS